MDILIEVNGTITVPEGISAVAVCSSFIDWIESKNWFFGGGFREETPIVFGGTVYSLERDLTAEDVEKAVAEWIREQGWKFDGRFQTIADNYYINTDGSGGAHVLDEI